MYLESLPVDKMTDTNGHVTTTWRNHFEQIVRQVQTFLPNEGYKLPHQPDPRAASTNVLGLDQRKNLGGIYYHSVNNTVSANIKKYPATGDATYNYIPHVCHYEVDTKTTRDKLPSSERSGKIVTAADNNAEAYMWVNGAWRTLTLT